MKIFILSALIVISQTWSQTSCSRENCCREFHRCSEVPEYLRTYNEKNCKGIHVRDGINAQIRFMSQEEVSNSNYEHCTHGGTYHT